MQRLHQSLQQLISSELLLIGVAVIVALVALALGADRTYVLLAAGILITFLLWLIAIHIFYSRRAARQAQQIINDDIWVHWHYASDEWDRLSRDAELVKQRQQQVRVWRNAVLKNIVIMGLLITLVPPLLFWNRGWQTNLGWVLIALGILSVFTRSTFRQLHEFADPFPQPGLAVVEIIIGPRGIAHPTQLVMFHQPRWSIANAKLETGDPSRVRIVLQLRAGRNAQIPYDLVLPVPSDKDAEAKALVEKIRATFVLAK